MKAICIRAAVLFLIFLIISACGGTKNKTLLMATTTSVDDTGLLDFIAPKFFKDTKIKLKWLSMGTGKALELGKNCDVDILLVHNPNAEQKFIKKGYGVDRVNVMYNDFLLVGPKKDPAHIEGEPSISAFKKIANNKILFISRGDNSGTYDKEKELWKETNLTLPSRSRWYLQSGRGMMDTLNMASQLLGYTLTDRGTFIKFVSVCGKNCPLKVFDQGGAELKNQYSVMIVNSGRCNNINVKGANKFKNWLISKRGQNLISSFKLLNKKLFIPNATKKGFG